MSFPSFSCDDFATVMHFSNLGTLATSTPSADALATFLQVLFYLVAGGIGLKVLLTKKPGHSELATKRELTEGLSKKADKTELKRIEDEVKQLDEDLDEKTDRILEKLDEVKNGISSELKEFSNEARKGRAAIWNKVNKDAERITAVESRKS